jgi:hypothetical protein
MVSQIIKVVIRREMIGVFVVRFVSLRNEDDDTQFSSLVVKLRYYTCM